VNEKSDRCHGLASLPNESASKHSSLSLMGGNVRLRSSRSMRRAGEDNPVKSLANQSAGYRSASMAFPGTRGATAVQSTADRVVNVHGDWALVE